MKFYRVNTSYESDLYGLKVKDTFVDIFDYILFWCQTENCTLATKNHFSDSYLEHCNKYNHHPCQYTDAASNIANWWGKFENLELEKKINSKSYLAKLQKNNGNEISKIINSKDELNAEVDKCSGHNWILKKPEGFSGIGNILFNKGKIPENIKFPMILEEYHNRVIDLSFSYEINSSEIVLVSKNINFYNKSGQLRGSFIEEEPQQIDQILEEYSIKLGDIIKAQKECLNKFVSEGAAGAIQIDSYIYKSYENFVARPIVEVNYRKTFSYIFNSFQKFLKPSQIGLVLLCGDNELNQFDTFLDLKMALKNNLYNDGGGILPISPIDRKIQIFLLVEAPSNIEGLLEFFVSYVIKEKKQTDFRQEALTYLSQLI